MKAFIKISGLGLLSLGLGAAYFNSKTQEVPEATGPSYKHLRRGFYSDNPNRHFISRPPDSIGIIGTGLAGLCMAKELISQGYKVEILEKNQESEGIWFDNLSEVGLKGPATHYQFPDYPFPEGTDGFPELPAIKTWLKSYSDHFKVTPRILFDSEVRKVVKQRNSSWKVFLTNTDVKKYDLLIICTGVFNTPFVPSFNGEGKFKGQIIHSSKLTDYENMLKDKKVVVVGGGRTAMEIGKLSHRVAKQTYSVFKSFDISLKADHFINDWPYISLVLSNFSKLFTVNYDNNQSSFIYNYLKPLRKLHDKFLRLTMKDLPSELVPDKLFFPYRVNLRVEEYVDAVKKGDIKVEKGEITGYTETGIIVNGKEIEADVVVMCTGFKKNFFGLDKGQNDVWMYRNMIMPEHPNLIFIGTIDTLYIPLYINIQAVWLTELLRGTFRIPNAKEMKEEIEIRKARLGKHFEGQEYCAYGWIFTQDLVNQLLEDMRMSTVRNKSLKDEWIMGNSPSDYKTVVTHRI